MGILAVSIEINRTPISSHLTSNLRKAGKLRGEAFIATMKNRTLRYENYPLKIAVLIVAKQPYYVKIIISEWLGFIFK